ncbi:MAG: hypothetical protein Q8L81_06420 [Bacteroidota bacterium]|nr:hypothetical protein [Bacteroidota bacterium]
MIYTVFQYVPILEEEVPHTNTELAKKGAEDDTTGNGSDETDLDGDDAIYDHFNLGLIDHYSKNLTHSTNKRSYSSFFQKINIPPPKV